MVLGPRFFHPPSPESSVSSQTMQKDSIEKAYWLLKSINPGETFHFCLYSFTKNYSYGSTPMSRGKCLPRIKMEEGLWISGGQSAIYVTFNNYVFSFHCWVCYQILIQKPSSIFLTLTGIFVFLFLEEIFEKKHFIFSRWFSYLDLQRDLPLEGASCFCCEHFLLEMASGSKRKPSSRTSILIVELSYSKVPFHSCKLVGLTGIIWLPPPPYYPFCITRTFKD